LIPLANVLGYPGDDVSPLVLKRLVKRQGFQEVAELRILSEDQIRQPGGLTMTSEIDLVQSL